MTVINTDDTTLDAIAERIFREADGDRRRAYELLRECTGPEYAGLFHGITQKFVAAGHRDRAFQLLHDFTELKNTYEVEKILRRKFQVADNPPIILNTAQQRDALDLLHSLPNACTPLVFFDPQFRAVMDKLKYGNEGARQRERFKLPQMSKDYIDACCIEIARVLRPSGYLMRWIDAFCLCEAHHLHIAGKRKPLKMVSLAAWDNLDFGNGYRFRERGDYLLALQKPPIKARATWRDRGIPSRWQEKVDKKLHTHVKPIGLIERLIGGLTEPGDLVVDPAAGSFVVMYAARRLGREFVGCDLVVPDQKRGRCEVINISEATATLPPRKGLHSGRTEGRPR